MERKNLRLVSGRPTCNRLSMIALILSGKMQKMDHNDFFVKGGTAKYNATFKSVVYSLSFGQCF